jgi:hypothetical protein
MAQTLFVRRTPLSEAARGIVAVFSALGLEARVTDLSAARAFFRAQSHGAYLNRVLDLAQVSHIVMTNDPFDAVERQIWASGVTLGPRFSTALRIDRLLDDWPGACRLLKSRSLRRHAPSKKRSTSFGTACLRMWVRSSACFQLAACPLHRSSLRGLS